MSAELTEQVVITTEFRLFRRTENSQNSAPNPSAEEKTTRNSVPRTEIEAKSSFLNPSAKEKTTRNFVPNHSEAEKTTGNKTRQWQSPTVVKLWVLVESGRIGFHHPGKKIFCSIFRLFRSNSFFRRILFRSVPSFGMDSFAELGMSTFFHGITESVPSLFRGNFSERNSVPNPSWAPALT